jgi:hypothetical protein
MCQYKCEWRWMLKEDVPEYRARDSRARQSKTLVGDALLQTAQATTAMRRLNGSTSSPPSTSWRFGNQPGRLEATKVSINGNMG